MARTVEKLHMPATVDLQQCSKKGCVYLCTCTYGSPTSSRNISIKSPRGPSANKQKYVKRPDRIVLIGGQEDKSILWHWYFLAEGHR